MKRLFQLVMLIGIGSIMGCRGKSAKVQSFIDGLYVNHAAGDVSVADDTLVFRHTEENHYVIERHTGYQVVRDGKLLPKKFLRQRFEGDYDPANRVLNETITGRVFRFDPDKRVLLLKQAVYRKLD